MVVNEEIVCLVFTRLLRMTVKVDRSWHGVEINTVDVNPYNPSAKEQDLVRDIQGWLDNNGYNPSFYRVDIVTDATKILM